MHHARPNRCAAASSDWREWREGQFARLAAEFGGGGLAVVVEAGAMVSLVAVLCTLMCTTSRALAAMAQLRRVPPVAEPGVAWPLAWRCLAASHL